MRVQRPISMLLLIALLAWSVSGVCSPMPSMHGMQCMMGGAEPVAATHDCCPPERTLAMSCHGKRTDSLTRCAVIADDEAVLTTTKYRDDGKTRAADRSTSASNAVSPEVPRLRFEVAMLPHSPEVLDRKADLRI